MNAWTSTRDKAGREPQAAGGATRLPFFLAGAFLVLAFALAAALRVHGLGQQVLLDDEWHAINVLLASGYADIFLHYHLADNCIPLTLLYKAMAGAVGLTEERMRALQVACGLGVVALAPWLAWRATRDLPATALYAVLLAAAPFLVLYSRIARPYPVATLLAIGALAVLWRWRGMRTLAAAAAFATLTALAAWFHLLYVLPSAAALLFVLGEDARRRDWGRLSGSVGLTLASAVATLALVGPPLLMDLGRLVDKVAQQRRPDLLTLERMASLFAGGAPEWALVPLLAVAAYGAWVLARRDLALGLFLVWVGFLPLAIVFALGSEFTFLGHTIGRYVFVLQAIFLFWIAQGTVALAGLVPWRGAPAAAAGLAAAAYLACTPTIGQVRTLGPWYAHIYNTLDYDPEYNFAQHQYRGFPVPSFYRRLGLLPPRSVTIIEAPFNAGAPENRFAYFAAVHRQRERMGFLHDLCLDGPRVGEVPDDPRFRFRNFVFLGNFHAVAGSGARYLVLHRGPRAGKPFAEAPRCIEKLTRLYGPPAEDAEGIVVFDLEASRRRGAVE